MKIFARFRTIFEIALRTSWAHLAAQKTEPQKLRPVPLHSEARHCPHFYWAELEHGQAVFWCVFMFVQFLNFWDKAKSSVWEQHFMLFESSLSSLDSLFVWIGCLCCIVLLYWLLWILEFMTFALGDAGECTALSRPSGHLLNFQHFFDLQSA